MFEGIKNYFTPTASEIENQRNREELRQAFRDRGLPIPDFHSGGLPETPLTEMPADFLALMDLSTSLPPEEALRIQREEGLI